MKQLTDIFGVLLRLYERRFEPEKLRPLVEGYWRTLLFGGITMIVLIVLFGVWTFVGTLQNLGSAQTSAGSVPQVALDRMRLEEAIRSYAQRQEAFKQAQRSSASFADPSK